MFPLGENSLNPSFINSSVVIKEKPRKSQADSGSVKFRVAGVALGMIVAIGGAFLAGK